VGSALLEGVAHQCIDLGAVDDASGIGGEALVRGPFRMAEQGREPLKLRIVADGERQHAVRGRKAAVGHDVGVAVAVAPRRAAGNEVVLGDVGEEREARLEERDLATVWPRPLAQRAASAPRMAMVASMPVARSTMATPYFMGSPVSSPLMLMSPLSAWRMKS
jgi:hypothetical protein